MRSMEKAEMRFLRMAGGYRMTDHKSNKDIRDELGITDTNTIIRKYK
jgi:hypothetical protein